MLEKREGADLPQRHRDTERIKDERANAVAMVGWEHICLPFLCGREVEVRPGFAEDLPGQRWTGPLQRTARRNRAGELEARESGTEYQGWQC